MVLGTLGLAVVGVAFIALRGAVPLRPVDLPVTLAVAAPGAGEREAMPVARSVPAEPVALVASRGIGLPASAVAVLPAAVSPALFLGEREPGLKLQSARSLSLASLERYRGVAVVSARSRTTLE